MALDLAGVRSGVQTMQVTVFGETKTVNKTDNVRSFVAKQMESAGIDSVTLYINGAEIINKTHIPNTFKTVTSLSLERNVKAGN